MKKKILTLLCLLSAGFSTAMADDVACIGATKYETLQEAFNAANNNETVGLLGNTSIDAEIVMPTGKAMTLDLGGFTLTATGSNGINFANSTTANASLTITNGTIAGTCSNATLCVGGQGNTLTLKADATASNNNSSVASVIAMSQDGGTPTKNTLNVYGTVAATEKTIGISSNGTETQNADINIYDGANISSAADAGVYLPGKANVTCNISGGTITGATAVYVRAGKLNITGGKLIGNGASAAYEYSAEGPKCTGDALVVENSNFEGNGAPTVSVAGGEFESANAQPVASYKNGSETQVTGFITGGTFNKTLTDTNLLNTSYTIVSDGKGDFKVVALATKIYTLADLELFRDNVYSGEKNYEGETVLLMNDIDASSATWAYGIGLLQGATSIDDDSALNPFKGTFDGQGYTIKGLTINSTNVQQSALFQCIEGATIKNLTLYECTIKGAGHRVGGIVARSFGNSSTTNLIQNCIVKNSKIICTADGNADFSLIGGIAATIGYTTITGCQVSGTYISGTTRGGSGSLVCNGAGGIVGRVNYDCTITNNTVVAGDSLSVEIRGKVKGVGAIIGEPGASPALTCSGNSYDSNIRVIHWNGTSFVTYEGASPRGYNVPEQTTEYPGITRATKSIAEAIVQVGKMDGGSFVVQPWETYDGTEKTPGKVVVKVGTTELTENTDYTITYEKMMEPGVYPQAIKITGYGSYFGTIYADFTVCKPLTHDEMTITPDELPARVYNGEPRLAVIKVTDRGVALTEGIDYEINYYNNTTDPGDVNKRDEVYYCLDKDDKQRDSRGSATEVRRAEVEVKGIGIYIGTKKFYFYILPQEMTDGLNSYFELNDKTNTLSFKEYRGVADDAMINVPSTFKPDATNFPALEYPVTNVKSGALGKANIECVILPPTLTSIEDDAFKGATNLHWIDASECSLYTPTKLSRTDGPFNGINERSLIYLNGTDVTGTNYVYKVAPGNYQCDVLEIVDDINSNQKGFDNNDAAKWGFENIIEFKANTVKNNRKLTATITTSDGTQQQGYTTCLPYDLPIPATIKAYQLAYSKDNQVGFEEVTGTLKALEPYVLIPSESKNTYFNASDVTVVKTFNYDLDTWTHEYVPTVPKKSEAISGQGGYALSGVMWYSTGNTDWYIMQNGNKWMQCTATDYPAPSVLPMRAIIISEGPRARQLFSIFNDADGSTTAIDNFVVDNDDKVEIFDLQGRRVLNPVKGSLYIINGKKQIF